MLYPKIFLKKGSVKDTELNQLLLNAAMYRMQEILNFCGLRDCVIIVKALAQFYGGNEPHHNISFYLPSSPAAGELCQFEGNDPKYNCADIQITSDDRSGDFCNYTSCKAGQMRSEAGQFLIRCCLVYRDGEEPHEDGVAEMARLADRLFEVYWDWLIRPERSDGVLCAIGVQVD